MAYYTRVSTRVSTETHKQHSPPQYCQWTLKPDKINVLGVHATWTHLQIFYDGNLVCIYIELKTHQYMSYVRYFRSLVQHVLRLHLPSIHLYPCRTQNLPILELCKVLPQSCTARVKTSSPIYSFVSMRQALQSRWAEFQCDIHRFCERVLISAKLDKLMFTWTCVSVQLLTIELQFEREHWEGEVGKNEAWRGLIGSDQGQTNQTFNSFLTREFCSTLKMEARYSSELSVLNKIHTAPHSRRRHSL
jgi:hypothetical protein